MYNTLTKVEIDEVRDVKVTNDITIRYNTLQERARKRNLNIAS